MYIFIVWYRDIETLNSPDFAPRPRAAHARSLPNCMYAVQCALLRRRLHGHSCPERRGRRVEPQSRRAGLQRRNWPER